MTPVAQGRMLIPRLLKAWRIQHISVLTEPFLRRFKVAKRRSTHIRHAELRIIRHVERFIPETRAAVRCCYYRAVTIINTWRHGAPVLLWHRTCAELNGSGGEPNFEYRTATLCTEPWTVLRAAALLRCCSVNAAANLQHPPPERKPRKQRPA